MPCSLTYIYREPVNRTDQLPRLESELRDEAHTFSPVMATTSWRPLQRESTPSPTAWCWPWPQAIMFHVKLRKVGGAERSTSQGLARGGRECGLR